MPKRLTDPGFRYVPAVATDLRRTFARVRRELRRASKNHPEKSKEAQQ